MAYLEKSEILDELFGDVVEEIKQSPIVVLKDGEVDPRFKKMSYSSGLLFNGCERKFQIQKLNPRERDDSKIDESIPWEQRLTFGFGHAVGLAVQDLLEGRSKNEVIFRMYCNWKEDLFAENEKQKKTFFHALNAVSQFMSMREDGFLDEYELVYYDGKPASELSFRITLPNGFRERGFVDIVLRNTTTGQFAIFEIKTDSGMYLQPGKYKNSAQATGYSVVLDKIEPGQTDYTVYYLVYMTRQEKWECFEFPKTHVMRAAWLEDRMEDFDRIERLVYRRGNTGLWPMRGNHCMNYNRACEYLGTCHLNIETMSQPLRERDLVDDEAGKYTFELTLEELL